MRQLTIGQVFEGNSDEPKVLSPGVFLSKDVLGVGALEGLGLSVSTELDLGKEGPVDLMNPVSSVVSHRCQGLPID